MLFDELVKVDGMTPHDALQRIASAEPFDRYPEIVAAFKEDVG